MQFSYKELVSGDGLVFKTDQGVDVEVLFEGGEATYIFVDDLEFKTSDDFLKGLFVKVNGNPITLMGIYQSAESQYDDVMAEVEQDMIDEIAMREELSSPYLTGRL